MFDKFDSLNDDDDDDDDVSSSLMTPFDGYPVLPLQVIFSP